MIKRNLIVLSMIAFFFYMDLAGQKIIKNPGVPENKNAGQALTAQKMMEITDASEHYFFRSPYSLKVGLDGSIYVMDKDQLLKFAPSGEFVRNFLKPGQGPDETSNVSNYIILEDNSVVVHIWAPNQLSYLVCGNVRGVWSAISRDLDSLLRQLIVLKFFVDRDKFPPVQRVWKLNQAFSDNLFFGQYFAMVMYEVK